MKRATGTAASRSPLIDLDAELRAVDRRRREALKRARAEDERERRFEPPTRITPGAWSELETTVYLEQAV
jgi:hypothetical protein